jgi:hypothetical protein
VANIGKALSYLIAAHIQSVGLVLLAWWVGEWLNDHHNVGFNWYVVTFTVALLGIIQTFYVIVRAAWREDKRGERREQK